MKSEVRNQYLRWYSQSDLDAPASRTVTQLIVLSLGMIMALLIVSTTVAFWIPAIQRSRLDASPLAKSLWIGQPGVKEMLFTDEKLSILELEISNTRDKERPESIQKFSRHPLKFMNKRDPNRSHELHGRTVELNDPIINRLQSDPVPTDPGIIPTQELLILLGYQDDELPKELSVRFGDDHKWQRVPVLFVANIKLPYQLKFLVRRPDYNTFYLRGHESKYGAVRFGPMTEQWPTGGALARDEEFSNCLSNLGITVKQQVSSGRFAYLLSDANGQQKDPSTWESITRQFKVAMAEYVKRNDLELEFNDKILNAVEPHGEAVAPQLPAPEFDLVEVRVKDLNHLRATARGCLNAGFPADDTLVSQVDQVHQIGRLLLVAMISICVSLLVIAAMVMIVVQRLRCELKVPEIGMLKAMGISGREFLRLYKTQAHILWQRSLLGGAGLALVTVGIIGLITAESGAEWLLLLANFGGATVLLAAITLPVIRYSLVWATRWARLSDPMETIRRA